MKICKALFLLGIFFAPTECKSDILTTSHVEKVRINQKRIKNIQPKQHFCSQNNIKKITCQKQSSEACKLANPTSQGPVCGFDHFGVKLDFNQECQACQNQNIKYYFKVTCNNTPKICTKTEECVNGLCVSILNDPQDANRQICNESEDCPDKTYLCVANKCIDKRELIGKLQKVEKTNPELALRTGRARREAMKNQRERRLKDALALEQLKQEISKTKRQSRKEDRRQKQLLKIRSQIAFN